MPRLHQAAYRGEFGKVEQLLEAGADVFERIQTDLVQNNSFVTSALAIAVERGHLDVAELLAKKMANTWVGFVYVFDCIILAFIFR